jgi:hypothetical protein
VLIPPCRQRITNVGNEDLIFLAICTPQFRDEAYEDIDPDPMPIGPARYNPSITGSSPAGLTNQFVSQATSYEGDIILPPVLLRRGSIVLPPIRDITSVMKWQMLLGSIQASISHFPSFFRHAFLLTLLGCLASTGLAVDGTKDQLFTSLLVMLALA